MTHINPDGQAVGGPQPTTPLAYAHVFSQSFEHTPAQIVGNRKALEIIRDTINRALTMPIDFESFTQSPEDIEHELFCADGEGYEIWVKLMPDEPVNPMKTPMMDDVWKRFPPYYMADHDRR